MPTPRLTKIDVFSRRPVPATTGNFFAAMAPMPGKHDLAAVRVAGQDERDTERGGFLQAAWIVGEEDDRLTRAAHQPADIARTLRPVAETDQFDFLSADPSQSCAHLATSHTRAR